MARLAFQPELAGKVRDYDFVVTGAGGWVGMAVVEMLESVFGEELPQHVQAYGSREKVLELRSGRKLVCKALHDLNVIDNPAVLVHCAFLTKDRLDNQSVESFIAGNQDIRDRVAAFIQKADLRGIFTLSSGAVYRKGTHQLDDNKQANPYGTMKLADEKLFMELTAAKQIPLCMPRLFNLSGPFINKHDLYALASMIKAAVAGNPIIVRAAHRVVRSYIHVADLVTLAISMVLEPASGDTALFDTEGDEAYEIGDLAQVMRETLGCPHLPIERPLRVEGQDDLYIGDGSIMRAMLGRHGLRLCGMKEQILDTAEYLRANYSCLAMV